MMLGICIIRSGLGQHWLAYRISQLNLDSIVSYDTELHRQFTYFNIILILAIVWCSTIDHRC